MDSGFRVLDSGLIQWNLDSGFHSLVGFRIPWAVFWIPKPRILDSTSKIFPDFGFYMSKFSQIPESGFTYMGGSRGGAGGPPPLPISIISRPDWGPKGPQKSFFETTPFISGSGWPPPPPPAYLKVCIRQCHPWSTHIFQFPLSVKKRRYIRVLWMFKLFLAKKPQVNLHGNLKRQTGYGILI